MSNIYLLFIQGILNNKYCKTLEEYILTYFSTDTFLYTLTNYVNQRITVEVVKLLDVPLYLKYFELYILIFKEYFPI